MRFQTSVCLLALSFTAACASVDPNEAYPKVAPFAETVAIGSTGDAADDPAIWIKENSLEESRVLGTDKQAGVYVYDLSGKVLQFLPTGELNNVDLRQGVMFGQQTVDLAAATNRTINGVSLFEISSDGTVEHAGDFQVETIEPYGLCTGYDESGYRVFVTYKTGQVEIYTLAREAGAYAATLENTLKLESQLEGCSYDEFQNVLFVGEEATGVWRIDLDRHQEFSRRAIDRVGSPTGLVADVEGMDIWRGPTNSGYLVVSAQEGDRYVVYERSAPNRWVGTFAINGTLDETIDGVSHTDGLTVTSVGVLPESPTGILVVQDDSNGDEGLTQNFKFVSWKAIEAALSAPAN